MQDSGERPSAPLHMDMGVSVVTLSQFEDRLGDLMTGSCEHALVCIGLERSGQGHSLPLLLKALAETNVATRRSGNLVATRGDEVVCLLPGCSRANALVFARMLRAAVQAPMARGKVLQLGIGVVPVNDARVSPQALLRLAHTVCREATRRGNNCIEVHEPG